MQSQKNYQIILEINNFIISALKLDELFLKISESVINELNFDYSSIGLYKPENDTLELYPFGDRIPLSPGSELPRNGSHVGWVFDNKKTLIADDISKTQKFTTDKLLNKVGITSYIITPLISRDNIIGTLNLGSFTPNEFVEDDIEFISLVAKQIALAIDNARSHEQIEKLKNRLEKDNTSLQEEIKTVSNFEEIIGSDRSLKEVLSKVDMVADTDASVLIRGETGTGKELVARAIHNCSKRSERSLIKVNCPAIPSGLIESELFGHEKGSFTGAITKKIGKFELADGGTIFLDELGDLPLDAQAKLLRVLQEKEFERVGGNHTYKVDVRVIAATNRNLEQAVRESKFRADLYYRLNVFPIELPALRERSEDIPALSNYFMSKYSKRLGKVVNSISEDTINKLKDYSWPGNIRELENIIERTVIISKDRVLEIRQDLVNSPGKINPLDSTSTRMEDIEREHIIKVLNQTKWQVHGKDGAAKILDLNPSTLRSMMKKLGIKKKTVQQN